MTIKEIQEQLETSDKPIAKALHVGDHFKVLIFGFKKGMKLQNHKAYHPTKLLVMSGRVIYHQNKKTTQLKKFDEVEIPAEVEHSLSALDESLILLTQG